jgi:glycosyltransferase involved in cell wall biosynthesis
MSVVAPCMNEEDGLEVFYLRVITTLKSLSISDYEIILIDDGSTDHTWDLISYLNKRDSRVRGLQLSRNFGHQAALTAGLTLAKGEYIFIIDSDLQDPPELLKPMMDKMKEGFDVVYGQRKERAGETKFKLATASAFYKTLSLLADIQIPKDTGDFRLINRKVLNAYNSLTESQRFTRGLIAWLGFRQIPIQYDRHPRFAGTTKYPLKKMINFSIDALTGFSLKPLRLIICMGLGASLVSILAFFYSIYGWLLSNTVPGWASIMTAVCFLSSVQLLCIGVVGEYVGRTFSESKKRPLYLIQNQTAEHEQSLQIDVLKQSLRAHMNNENSFH